MEAAQREIVIEHIIKHIDKHGYCRVGWAAKIALNLNAEISVVDKEQIANLCVQSGEYNKERAAKTYVDWNIVKNPAYAKTQLEIQQITSTTKLNRMSKNATIVNIIIGILNILLLVWQICSK